MHLQQLIKYCLSKKGVESEERVSDSALQIKVAGLLFAVVNEQLENPTLCIKTSPELAEQLRAEFTEIVPCEQLNKCQWSTILLDGSIPDSKLYFLIDGAYRRAIEHLPETTRHTLGL